MLATSMNQNTIDLAMQDAAYDRSLHMLADYLRSQAYRFITVTPESHRRVRERNPEFWSQTIRDAFGWSRPFKASLLPGAIIDDLANARIIVPYQNGWLSRVRFSSFDELLLVHSAYPTTDAGSVFFGPDSYRFATALQIHLKTLDNPVRRAIDIGCGTGIGGLVVARAFPAAEVILSDINDAALRLASINAAVASLSVQCCRSNLLKSIDGLFDLICANPPYLVDSAQRTYRNGGGALGSQLSLAIIESAVSRLVSGGTLLLYTGVPIIDGEDPFKFAAMKCLDAAGFTRSYCEIDPDVFGEELDSPAYAAVDRIASVVLTATNPR